MTRAISTTDSSEPVNINHLLVTLEPGDVPSNFNPISQSIEDVIRSVFSVALEAKLAGIEASADVNLTGVDLQQAIDAATGSVEWREEGISLDEAIDGVGDLLATLDEFSFDSAANSFTFTLKDASITPEKTKASTASEQKGWRETFGSAHIGAGLDLPDAAESNTGDVRIFIQDVASGLSWRDLRDQGTIIDSASAADVALYMGDQPGWVRVGNLLQAPGEDAAEALAVARENSFRLNHVEQATVDIAHVVDSVSWANAPSAEAQFAAFPPDSVVGQKISLTDRTALDPATQLVGAQWYVTRSDQNPIPAHSELLARVTIDQVPIDYRLSVGASISQLYDYQELARDNTWIYYGIGGIGSVARAGAIEKRDEKFHTAYHGNLAGRALEQVQTIADALERWPGRAFTHPVELTEEVATTISVYLDAIDGYYPDNARMRVDMAGRKGALRSLSLSDPATIDLDANIVGGLITNSLADGFAEGYLEIVPSDSLVFLARIPFRIRIRRSDGWRTLAGSSPYTVRTTDTEFEFEVEQTQGSAPTPLTHTKRVSRRLITEAVKHVVVAENRPDSNNATILYLDLNFNAAGTELTAVMREDGFGAGEFGRWSIKSVGAK